MIYLGKLKIIDNFIVACDYEFILKKIDGAIKNRKRLLISPIASHTLVRAHYDEKLKKILDDFDYLVPDSQWVKRSIWFLYGKRLKERVYGPDLMLKICQLSQERKWKIFLYGNKKEVLEKLIIKLRKLFPKINIVEKEESKFRDLTQEEKESLVKKIEKSRADIVFISLGSPKQEVFAYELSKLLKSNKILISVGAAFDFISGVKKQAPVWIQKAGFEWLFRLINEPKRLCKRYMIYAFLFLWQILRKKINFKKNINLFFTPLFILLFFLSFYSKIYKEIPIRYWDEHDWVGKSYYFDLLIKRDFKNDLWLTYPSYNQPKLVDYIYGLRLYPYYLKYGEKYKSKDRNYDFGQFLIDHNFYFIHSENYLEYKSNKSDFIDWGKNPKEVFDVTPQYLVDKFGPAIKKTIDLIFLARQVNVILLSLNIVIVFFLTFLLTNSKLFSILVSIFYGTNTLIVEASLRAQSEGLFLFLFNLSFLFLSLFFNNNRFDFKIGILFFITGALLTATKLNGLMMPLIFNFLSGLVILYFYFLKKKLLFKVIKTLIFGNFLFILIFILHHPLLMRFPLRGTILLFQHRYKTAIHQAKYELPETALWSFKDRILAFYKNFFSPQGVIYFNNYYPLKTLITKYPNFFSKVFLVSFLTGLFLFIKRKLKECWWFLVSFLLTLLFMMNYLLLNWDRYFVHLLFFVIFFNLFFFRYLFTELSHKEDLDKHNK